MFDFKKMGAYKILPSQVLIVPGYTSEEIIAMSATTNSSSASALKNGTSSKDKTQKNEDNKNKKNDSSSSGSGSKVKSRMVKSQRGFVTDWINENLVIKKKTSSRANPWKNIDMSKNAAAKNKATNYAAVAKKALGGSSGGSSSSGKKASSVKSTKKTKTTKKKTKASNKDKKTSKTTKGNTGSKVKKNSKVNESSGATSTKSNVEIEKPKALLFSPTSIEYNPHRKDFEEFNSAEGLILIEKACDHFAELQLSLDVHQAMRIQENGTIELSKDDKRPIDIITEGAPTLLDKETNLGHFIDPADFTDSYIEIRRGFFDRYIGRPLTVISDLFPVITRCYITDISYSIDEGEEQAKYSITFKEVDNTWN